MTIRLRRPLGSALAMSLLVACQPAPPPAASTPSCAVGAVDCACTAGGGCDPGLACVGAKCARPEPPPIPIEMPRARAGDEPLPQTVVVHCTRAGELILDGAPIDDAKLRERLVEKINLDRNLEGIVDCDREAPTGRLLAVLDLMRQVGIAKVGVSAATQPRVEAPEPAR